MGLEDQIPRKVIIFGVGDFARIAYIYLSKDSPHEVVAFTVHQEYITTPTLVGIPVVPFENLIETHPPDQYAMLVAMGFRDINHARAGIYTQCKEMNYPFISYINSKATHWGEIEIGENTFIFEDNVIQPFVKIGNNTVLWSGNHIGHDSTIGDHVFIASHAVVSGNCTIGNYCFVGVNATFADGVKVGESCLIGAGALITRDAEPEGIYKGNYSKRANVKSTEINF